MDTKYYRKKPVVIEAVKWDGHKMDNPPKWIIDALNKEPGVDGNVWRAGNEIYIYTLEGTMTAKPNDWIIKGVSGELYPCKPDIFEKTYEPVEPIDDKDAGVTNQIYSINPTGKENNLEDKNVSVGLEDIIKRYLFHEKSIHNKIWVKKEQAIKAIIYTLGLLSQKP